MAPNREQGSFERRTDEPGAPETPLEVSAPGWRATLARTFKETKDDRISITAAGVGLYWFLAVFPLLFAAIGLLQLLRVSPSFTQGINKAITTALPGDAASILTHAVSTSQQRATGGSVALIVGIAVALWSASSGMAAAQVGLDVAYDVPEDRKFLKKRLMGIVLIAAALVLGGAAVALLVFGQPLGVFIQKHVPAGDYFLWAWTVIRWVLTVLAVVTLFALFYYIGPNRKPPSWAWISPGGLVGTLIWLAAAAGFSVYVSNFGGSYAKTYGALAGVVILVLWLYISAFALLFGAELNGELERQRTMRSERQP